MTTDRTTALIRKPPIQAQLPYRCPWDAELRELPVQCHSCREPIDPSWVRGLIKQPVPKMIEVEATAVCLPCKRFVPVVVRLYDDGRVLFGSNGHWTRGRGVRGWKRTWGRIRSAIQQRIGR